MSWPSDGHRRAFIAAMPKVELHLHIEGSLEPEMLFALAQRNQVSIPFSNIEEVRKAYQFNHLQDFLDIYYQGMKVLQQVQDFYDLTMAYLQRMQQQNARHVEIFFDPQAHLERGIAFETIVTGIHQALEDGRQKLGISSHLIMCFLRHLDEADGLRTLEAARPYKKWIKGVGLDSSELGHPPEKFTRLFDKAAAEGYLRVAHAGEEGPPAYVAGALDHLGVDRIDHGNRALEDADLTARLAEMAIPLTVCPLSNLKLCVVDDLAQHPLREMLQKGLKATVNADDPSYFGGYLDDNFYAVGEALDLSHPELEQLGRNAIEAAFLSDSGRQELMAAFDRFGADFTADAMPKS